MEPLELLDILREAVALSIGSEDRVAVSYSGGLDSSLIARIASERTAVVCYSCVTAKSPDARNIQGYARSDGCVLKTLLLTEDNLPEIAKRAASALGTSDPVKIAYTIPTMAVIESCDENRILAGNGADELFAGYEKYATGCQNAETQMAEDLAKSLEEAEHLGHMARSFGKEILFPFLTEQVVTAARSIPFEQKVAGSTRKVILREAGRQIKLSAADRAKKAAQYSSGTLSMMRAMAKRRNATLSSWTQDIVSGKPLDKD